MRKDPMRWLDEATGKELLDRGTDSFRLAEGRNQRWERYGTAGLVSAPGEPGASAAVDAFLEHPLAGGLKALYHRTLVQAPGENNRPVLIWGKPESPCFTAHEGGLAYRVDFSTGYSCGLFLDQRSNRSLLRQRPPARLLNCFAYTCSFSVAAASAGSATTSIDLSRRSLERGKENFEANGLSLDSHQFFAGDVFRHLPRLARSGERFDAIVLDPPTFSRSREGRVFQIAKDFVRLIGLAVECAAPGARILVSTNSTRFDRHALRQAVFEACPTAGSISFPPALPDIHDGACSLWFSVP